MLAHALIESDCGQVMEVDAHHTTCPNCGADHTAVVREVAGWHLGEEVLHPCYADYDEWISSKECHVKYEAWFKQSPRE